MGEIADRTRVKWTVVVTLTVVFLATLYRSGPPRVVPGNAPVEAFSAERAFEHVEVIGASPHPMGSARNTEVRDYIVEQLIELGLDPEILGDGRPPESILARVAGKGSGKALVLMSHYDSAYGAPGASDAASCVAAILEAVRAASHMQPLNNDLFILITDGEERGLLGAKALARDTALIKSIGIVCNFEARGHFGPVVMFETHPKNQWAIGEFSRASSRPFCSSLTQTIYDAMPNGTDYSVFKDCGVQGLNFAFIGGPLVYHTPNDSVGNLDLRSLQHHGIYALDLIRHFGNVDLEREPGESTVHFSLFSKAVIHYPRPWAVGAGVLLTGCFILLVGGAVGRRRVRFWRVALSALNFSLTGLAVLGVCELAWTQALRSQGLAGFLLEHQGLAVGVLGLVCLAPLCLVFWLARRWLNEVEAVLGPLAVFLALLVITVARAPGFSYLFFWPLAAAVPLLVHTAFRNPKLPYTAWTGPLAALPAIVAIPLKIPLLAPVFAAFPEHSAPSVGTAFLLCGLTAPVLCRSVAAGELASQNAQPLGGA